ncbi:dual-specificity protein phosphatase, partial [Zymoseptoria tritici IPO323]
MEDKPEAYPDGPICVYDPRIDLYLEPTAEQARQYDVIMNVASEVRNPLVKHDVPPPSQAKEPEYIHIPWEHNSDIVPDLLRLVKLIDERVMEGKRILIHCQCGVSRSASLVVAYGIYKNSDASVQEAYDAVKKRSKWIGPNMNLIMQLQEFRSSLAR